MSRSRAAALAAVLLSGLVLGCELEYPEVVVVNRTAPQVLLKDISFRGCLWDGVLPFGEATVPQACLPGGDRVHFKKFDPLQYGDEVAEDELVRESCREEESGDCPWDLDGEVDQPLWFNYRTLEVKDADYGDFLVIEIRLDRVEQDFEVPGPYGH